MRWTVHGERVLYESPWIELRLADVELPDGQRLEHHVLRYPQQAAGSVVTDPERGVLLLWRHRFIADVWGWEIPAGRIELGETPMAAAAREAEEETGWRPGPLRPLVRFRPSGGSSDQWFHIFVADTATHVGDPTDVTEAAELRWHTPDEARALITGGEVTDGLSLTALSYWFAFAR
ncbi:MAG TPA: NUDIX domain-containing protein [Acidimicrobiales bacterium]|nr:NUDIX domain-containing protein [Acidimicrobiales bacterium]